MTKKRKDEETYVREFLKRTEELCAKLSKKRKRKKNPNESEVALARIAWILEESVLPEMRDFRSENRALSFALMGIVIAFLTFIATLVI